MMRIASHDGDRPPAAGIDPPPGARLTRWTLAAALLIALAMLASVMVLRLDQATADAYVAEDGPVEMSGALFLLLGAGMAFVGFLRVRRSSDGGREATVKSFAYLALALFLLMACGEELSWGQRLFGFGTPDAIKGVNAQGETSLHNLYGNADGQNASTQLFEAAWILFGVVVPLAAAAWARAGHLLRRFLPVAPMWLALLFVGQQLLWHPVQAEFRRDPGAWHATYRAKIGGDTFRVRSPEEARARHVTSPGGLTEVMETNVELLLAVGAFCVMIAVPRPVAIARRSIPHGVRAESANA